MILPYDKNTIFSPQVQEFIANLYIFLDKQTMLLCKFTKTFFDKKVIFSIKLYRNGTKTVPMTYLFNLASNISFSFSNPGFPKRANIFRL